MPGIELTVVIKTVKHVMGMLRSDLVALDSIVMMKEKTGNVVWVRVWVPQILDSGVEGFS